MQRGAAVAEKLMAYLDWIFVLFGGALALAGGWVQLHPERIVPAPSDAGQNASAPHTDWQLDRSARVKIRMLGAWFLFMGAFFALQMAFDLLGRPWWMGTLSGLMTAIAAVTLVYLRVRRQRHGRRHLVQQSPLPGKVLELR